VTHCSLAENVQVSALRHYAAPKLEAATSSETAVNFYQITRRQIAEDVNAHTVSREPQTAGTITLIRDDNDDDNDDLSFSNQ
jgi:hypothetical protein